MNVQDKYSFKLCINEMPTISKGAITKETLGSYLANVLGLIPARGKGIVAIKLINLFSEIAGKRDYTIKTVSDEILQIKNGGMRWYFNIMMNVESIPLTRSNI